MFSLLSSKQWSTDENFRGISLRGRRRYIIDWL